MRFSDWHLQLFVFKKFEQDPLLYLVQVSHTSHTNHFSMIISQDKFSKISPYLLKFWPLKAHIFKVFLNSESKSALHSTFTGEYLQSIQTS